MIEKSRISCIDPLKDKFEVGKGKIKLTTQREGSRIYFYSSKTNEFIGYIYVSGSSSGAIYLGNHIIGEFKEKDNDYLIHPIVNGRYVPNSKVKSSPIDYLLGKIKI